MYQCVCDPSVQNGYEYSHWVASLFGYCVWSPKEQASFVFGLFNLGFWMVAQIPQIITTFRCKSVDSLSFAFIFTWLLGDFGNLTGCILTQQLPTQTWTAIWYVLVDSIMMLQYVYYTRESNKIEPKCSTEPPTKMLLAVLCLLSVGLFMRVSPFINNSSTFATSRVLLEVNENGTYICNPQIILPTYARVIGDVCAWVSGFLYFFGRIPQVSHNYKRKSVEGLSWTMFVCAASGNLCYGFSVVLAGVPWGSALFWENIFPYMLGSWFNLIWPLVILCQYFYYSILYRRLHYNKLP